MGYRTKLDYSSNRQISQREKTDTILSGSTVFGLPFSALTAGPNPVQSGLTESHTSVISIFSGNATTTIYTWFDPRMELAAGNLSALTSLTSGITQYTGDIFIGNNYNTIDGNISYTNYTGVSFTLDSVYIIELGGGAYSGTVQHLDLDFLSANSLDYSGRTIWIDNPEITRTDRLIITDNPVNGYVWTCIDSEGMGEWQYNGSSSGSTIWTVGTGLNSAVLGGSGAIASGITSVSEGYNTTAGGNYSHAEGNYTIASGRASHAEGGIYVDGFITWVGSQAIGESSHSEGAKTTASGATSHAEGFSTTAVGDFSHSEGNDTQANGLSAHAEGGSTIASGDYSHAEGNAAKANGRVSHAEGSFTTASGDTSHSEGDNTTAGGNYSHAEGYSSRAMGTTSHAEGSSSATGDTSHSEGSFTLAGGTSSHAEGTNTTAGGNYSHSGGYYSSTYGETSFIHSHNSSITTGNKASILGGELNLINSSNYSSIIGGVNNLISGTSISSGIFVGTGNTITKTSRYSAIIGGVNNIISGHTNAFIGGGYGNLIDFCLTLGGGNQNESVLGGQFNKIFSSYNSSIIGGSGNTIDNNGGYGGGLNAILAGKENNLNQGYNSSIVGGIYNTLGNTLCHTDASSIIGGSGNVNISNYSVIIGGVNNTIPSSLPNSVILGGSDITATTSNTTYTSNLNIDYQDGLFTSKLGINTSSPSYPLDVYGSNTSRIYYSSSSPIGGSFTLSAKTGLPLIGVNTNSGVINQNGGISIGMRAWDDVTYPAYGKQGDTHIYSSKQANGLVLISSNGTGTEDYIDCYVGGDAGGGSSGVLAIHMHGTGATKGYVGFNTNLPTERLDVNGNGRFRSIGSSASAGALHYTSDGTLTTNTSDERLKTNVITLTTALDKVKQLRGVTYNWTENPNGDTRIGFIAQEVNSVIPELTFVNPNSEEQYMGVHYDNVTALLVEAVKELSNELSSNTFLETQTILAEDNNIELNYNGTHESSLDGGITIINGISENNNSYFKINSDGDFVTNVNLIPKGFVIPEYTPQSSSDSYGVIGNFTRDDNYLYIKGNNGWKRVNLENF